MIGVESPKPQCPLLFPSNLADSYIKEKSLVGFYTSLAKADAIERRSQLASVLQHPPVVSVNFVHKK